MTVHQQVLRVFQSSLKWGETLYLGWNTMKVLNVFNFVYM